MLNPAKQMRTMIITSLRKIRLHIWLLGGQFQINKERANQKIKAATIWHNKITKRRTLACIKDIV
jgi:hypothetical protein